MLIQKEEFLNQNNNNQDNEVNREEINNNLDELIENQNQNNDHNNNQRRNGGFDVFLSYGLNPEEVRTLRLIFHVTAAQESIMTGIPLDWSAEGIYQREERWLINQINGIMNRSRNGEGSNNNYISLNVNDGFLFSGRNSFGLFSENQIEGRHIFLIGFCLGLLTNVFGILLLMCRFKAVFKLGLICGMIISMIFFSKIFFR